MQVRHHSGVVVLMVRALYATHVGFVTRRVCLSLVVVPQMAVADVKQSGGKVSDQ